MYSKFPIICRIQKHYRALLRKHFMLVQGAQTGLMMATGDFIAQKYVEKRCWHEYNLWRTTEFAFLGSFLVGPAVTAWYKFLARKTCGRTDTLTAAKKMLADQLLFAPAFLAVFLVALGLLHGDDWDKIACKFDKPYKDIMIANWKIWPAVQLINFALVPFQFQVLFAQAVAVFWNTYLSWRTHRDELDVIQLNYDKIKKKKFEK